MLFYKIWFKILNFVKLRFSLSPDGAMSVQKNRA